ncbi:extensin family protein [Palleronia rufa]|uniref:extensin-like domain-containing protein n=1 Tax=Palleronia rufa TaxID=1530186 RepID=UPI000689C605|nr:extensin family protein [Palleronia rufa]
MTVRAAALALCALATAAAADAPTASQRPEPRAEAPAVISSPRPDARPPSILRRAADALTGGRSTAPGSVCGDAAIRGVPIAPIPGRISACGLARPVSVTKVSGVRLSRPATMDCPTARALNTWVAASVRPALDQVAGLEVAAHYTCRTRNNVAGAKVSEHGKGRAVDISGFRMADGSTVTVLDGWTDSRIGPALRRIHQGACGPFGTVLGPDADRYHQDNLHLDTARYRSGSYCR